MILIVLQARHTLHNIYYFDSYKSFDAEVDIGKSKNARSINADNSKAKKKISSVNTNLLGLIALLMPLKKRHEVSSEQVRL